MTDLLVIYYPSPCKIAAPSASLPSADETHKTEVLGADPTGAPLSAPTQTQVPDSSAKTSLEPPIPPHNQPAHQPLLNGPETHEFVPLNVEEAAAVMDGDEKPEHVYVHKGWRDAKVNGTFFLLFFGLFLTGLLFFVGQGLSGVWGKL